MEELLKWAGTLIQDHGYLAYPILLIWTFIEGETIVIIIGAMAYQAAQDGQPHPNLLLVMLCAFLGSLAGDQTWFVIGRSKGQAMLAKRPVWQQRADRIFRMLHRHGNWLMLSFRFLYGLRNATPFVIGMSQISARRFVILNTIGAAVWAVAFGLLGYVFGRAVEVVISKYKVAVLIGVGLLVLVVWLIRVVVRRRRARSVGREA